MNVRRVYPEDVAPPGFLNRDPDPAAAFAPVDVDEKARVDGSLNLAEQPSEPAAVPTSESSGPEPEPPPTRPVVDYSAARDVPYTLIYPVTFVIDRKCETLTEVRAHPPALWDIQDWAAGRLKTNYELMARMVDMDPVKLGALRWPDIDALQAITTAMLPQELRDAIAMSKQINTPGE